MRLAILTGSGTYALPGLTDPRAETLPSPFGDVPVTRGTIGEVEILHLARHRDGHELVSHQVTHRANVAALAAAGVDAALAVTVCGGCDPALELGSLVVFDDLHFPANRLPDGSTCTLHVEPGAPGRGHWVFVEPFSAPLREALLAGARAAGAPEVRDGGTYGHVDGPRFNTRSEIAQLRAAGVTVVSQTAGPETVLFGEAGVPYALVGFVTDHANGVSDVPTPTSQLAELIGSSRDTFATTLSGAVAALGTTPPPPVGDRITWP